MTEISITPSCTDILQQNAILILIVLRYRGDWCFPAYRKAIINNEMTENANEMTENVNEMTRNVNRTRNCSEL
jgi:hypothetical protein